MPRRSPQLLRGGFAPPLNRWVRYIACFGTSNRGAVGDMIFAGDVPPGMPFDSIEGVMIAAQYEWSVRHQLLRCGQQFSNAAIDWLLTFEFGGRATAERLRPSLS